MICGHAPCATRPDSRCVTPDLLELERILADLVSDALSMPQSGTSTKLSILNFRACKPTTCRLPRPGHCRKPGHFSPKLYTTTSSTGPSSGNQDPFAYCRDFVQKHDRDSYLISRFFPSHLQNACFAVRAFYVGWSMAPLDNAILFSNFYNED